MNTLFANQDWPTLGRPNAITYERFLELLKTKNSPAIPESSDIFRTLQLMNVDVSYALAQFRVESQYGTAGHAVVTRCWGNMLYDTNMTKRASGTYEPGNGYTYAKYSNWLDGVMDYCAYLHDYAENRNLASIYKTTAEWIGQPEGSSFHTWYVGIIIGDMARYEWKTVGFKETGDKMIDASKSFDNTTGKILTKYPLLKGTVLYKGTNGEVLTTYSGSDTVVWFLGLVNNSTSWGQVKITTNNTFQFVYMKNIDLTKILTA